MARSHAERATEYRKKESEAYRVADALDQLRDNLLTADSIGKTKLSGLFHEARTTGDDRATATAFVDVEDGEAVVDGVSILREGQWTPETRDMHDELLNVPTKPFMTSREFKRIAVGELRRAVSSFKQKAGTYARKASTQEALAKQEEA